MGGPMRFGLVQDAPPVRNIEGTLKQMEEYAAKAGKQGHRVNLLAFPELYVTGYFPEYWEHPIAPHDELTWLARMKKIAEREQVWILFGHPSFRAETTAHGVSRYGQELHNSESELPIYNAVSLVAPDGLVGTYAKVHLFGSEPETFTAGDMFPVWQTPWGRLAAQICFDVEFPEAARMVGLQGAQIILFPAAKMHPYGDWHRMFTAVRGLENRAFAATVNRTGAERDTEFCGGSCVMHPNGDWLIRAQPEPGLYVCDIHVADLETLDDTIDYYRQRRPELYRGIGE